MWKAGFNVFLRILAEELVKMQACTVG